MAPFLLGASLAAVAMQSLAHDNNLAIADLNMHGPPILAQSITRSVEILTLPASSTRQEVPKATEQFEDTTYNPVALNTELKTLRKMQQSLIDVVSINPKTVRIARIISHQISAPVAPTIGFDDAGNVFLHFKNDRVDAYLTVEQQALHLFCKIVGQRNIYIDNEPFFGKRLPTKIRDKLSEIFSA
jgi:hypothetical protein